MISPAIEEVLEKLYACEFEQDPYPRDPETVAGFDDAAAGGLIELRGDRYVLTDEGRQAGRSVIRRHRLAECLLRDVLSAAADRMDADACSFEHVLRDGLDEKICVLLGHPRTCPHGKQIPEGPCCRKARADRIVEVGPLADGRPGSGGRVAYLATRDNRQVQKVMAMGVLPGVDIQLIRRFPSYVFQVGYSQFTVDEDLAAIIFVHWRDGQPAGKAEQAGADR